VPRTSPADLELLVGADIHLAVHRLPGRYASRLRHAAQPPERARLLRHVLHGMSARGVRRHADHQFHPGSLDRLHVQVLRYVRLFVRHYRPSSSPASTHFYILGCFSPVSETPDRPVRS